MVVVVVVISPPPPKPLSVLLFIHVKPSSHSPLHVLHHPTETCFPSVQKGSQRLRHSLRRKAVYTGGRVDVISEGGSAREGRTWRAIREGEEREDRKRRGKKVEGWR